MIGDLLAEEQNLITTFSPKYPFLAGKTTLEGFLMPDTYRITGSASVEDVVGKMLQNFNRRIYQPFLESGKPLDAFYDVLILSSIVQEEEKVHPMSLLSLAFSKSVSGKAFVSVLMCQSVMKN